MKLIAELILNIGPRGRMPPRRRSSPGRPRYRPSAEQGTLTVNDEHASGHHAVFQFAHGLWWVEDLNSTNGTWLNNRRIYNAQRLKKGDKVRIGRSVVTIVSA
jgi:pSer/pThr/pTyr-binding forkhead associated (FHA) protein